MRHATSRCDTYSATSGDWRLKHTCHEERKTRLAEDQLSHLEAKQPEAETPEVRERSLVHLRPSQQCFYWIKALKAVQMLHSISSSKLHHSSGQWSILTSNFLLFNIIVMYCLSQNLPCYFTINSLPPKKHHNGPPSTNLSHASVGTASQTSVFNAHYICYNSFSHAIGFCFDERSAALLSTRMRRSHRTTPL